jgi:hypothetical protein
MKEGRLELTLFRIIDVIDPHRGHDTQAGTQRLEGTWPGQETPAVLALALIT